MLTPVQIEENYKTYIDLLRSSNRVDIEDLIDYINTTDFKTAPASTKFHCDFDGGLCQHSINVYNNLKFLVKAYRLDYDDGVLKLVALLHDLSKSNFYEKYYKNQKYYNDNGSKYDENGKFDWVSILSYKIKEPELRDIGADHGTTSYYIASKYIDFNDEEAFAIINHHMGMGELSPNRDLNAIANKYPLVFLLHTADMLSTYIFENNEIDQHRLKDEQENKETTSTN